MVFIGGVRWCCAQRLGAWGPLDRPTGHATWLGVHLSSLHRLSHIGYSTYQPTLTRGENGFWKCANAWLAGHALARLSLCFMPYHFLMSYCLWLCLILDIMKICMDFNPYGAFLSSDVPEMVNQQNSWSSLVIGAYLLYLEWNVCMLAVNICHQDLWPFPWATNRSSLIGRSSRRGCRIA
jgi:hypothetical protein